MASDESPNGENDIVRRIVADATSAESRRQLQIQMTDELFVDTQKLLSSINEALLPTDQANALKLARSNIDGLRQVLQLFPYSR